MSVLFIIKRTDSQYLILTRPHDLQTAAWKTWTGRQRKISIKRARQTRSKRYKQSKDTDRLVWRDRKTQTRH